MEPSKRVPAHGDTDFVSESADEASLVAFPMSAVEERERTELAAVREEIDAVLADLDRLGVRPGR